MDDRFQLKGLYSFLANEDLEKTMTNEKEDPNYEEFLNGLPGHNDVKYEALKSAQELKKLQKELEKCQKDLARERMMSQITRKDQKRQLDQYKKQEASSKTKIILLEKKVEDLEAAHERIIVELSSFQNRNKDLENAHERVIVQLSYLENKNRDLVNAYELQKEEIKILKQKISSKIQQSEEHQINIPQKFKEEALKYQIQIVQLKIKLAQAEESAQSKENYINLLNKKLGKIQTLDNKFQVELRKGMKYYKRL